MAVEFPKNILKFRDVFKNNFVAILVTPRVLTYFLEAVNTNCDVY